MIKNTFEEFLTIFWGSISNESLTKYIALVVTLGFVYMVFKGGRKK